MCLKKTDLLEIGSPQLEIGTDRRTMGFEQYITALEMALLLVNQSGKNKCYLIV